METQIIDEIRLRFVILGDIVVMIELFPDYLPEVCDLALDLDNCRFDLLQKLSCFFIYLARHLSSCDIYQTDSFRVRPP